VTVYVEIQKMSDEDETIIEVVQKDHINLTKSTSFSIHARTEEGALNDHKVTHLYFLAKYDTSSANAKVGIGLYNSDGVLVLRWEAPTGKLQNLNKSFLADDSLVSNMSSGGYYAVEYKADNKDSFGDDSSGESDYVKFYSYRLIVHAVPSAAKAVETKAVTESSGCWRSLCCMATTAVEPTVPMKSSPEAAGAPAQAPVQKPTSAPLQTPAQPEPQALGESEAEPRPAEPATSANE
jgi:hypothetical protein